MLLSNTLFSCLTFFTVLLYLASSVTIVINLLFDKQHPNLREISLGLGGLAIIGHLFLSLHNIDASGVIAHDFFNMLSLVFFVISILYLITAITKPIDMLAIIIFPAAAIAILLDLGIALPSQFKASLNLSLQAHIFLSILSYALLTLAAFQAVMLSLQEKQLHARHPSHFVNTLPPLQVMEEMLFQTLGLGVIALGLALLSGFIFLDDIFAQHLVHKTALSILAWFVFSILLWGRLYFGWRGQKAVKWVYGGYISLMLSYFGSKFVLQLILNQA